MGRVLPIIVALLLLGGCGRSGTAGAGVAAVNTPPSAVEPRQLVFAVSSSADPILREAAVLFADKLEELSDGELTVELVASADPTGVFSGGGAQFCYLDARGDAAFSTDFATLSEPMRFRDYNGFTMGLNSTEMLELLNEGLEESRGARLLGAFYQGTGQLISNRVPVDEDLRGERPADSEEAGEPEPLTVLVRADSNLTELLGEYGMEVVVEKTAATRLQGLLDGSAAMAEFSAGELQAARFSGDVYFLNSNHSMTPKWLAVDSAVWGGLSSVQQAAVLEAMAYMFPLIDRFYQNREAEIAMQLRSQGVAFDKSFSGLTAAAAELDIRSAATDSHKRYILDIFSSMS